MDYLTENEIIELTCVDEIAGDLNKLLKKYKEEGNKEKEKETLLKMMNLSCGYRHLSDKMVSNFFEDDYLKGRV